MKRENLIAYRGDRSQEIMAKKYGVRQQSWCKWENGQTKPSVVIMKTLEKESGIPMESLFPDVFLEGDKYEIH